MSIDIDELERKAKAATPGPWFAEDRTPKGAGFSLIAPAAPYHSGLVAHYCSSADAAFVASANPAAILELVAEVHRLRAELAAAQAREKVLRTGLRSAFDHIEMASLEASHCNDAARISDALAYRSDDTALRQAIRAAKEEMRERCARVCERSVYYIVQSSAAGIRALEVE